MAATDWVTLACLGGGARGSDRLGHECLLWWESLPLPLEQGLVCEERDLDGGPALHAPLSTDAFHSSPCFLQEHS